jgi:tetratricopeptide (TPR) repeat protein
MLVLVMRIFLGYGAICMPMVGIQEKLPSQAYLMSVKELQQEEKWDEIISLGKRALEQSEGKERFIILDQMVSTYFRLGDFLAAEESSEDLLALGESLEDAGLLVGSLYKFSAAVRGKAGSQEELFEKARSLANRALIEYEKNRLDDPILRAKVLYNAGAAECDDPKGDYKRGALMYKEALSLLAKHSVEYDDYSHRLMIRLGKAYLLQGDSAASLVLLEGLEKESLEERTRMHMRYLKAQVLCSRGSYELSIEEAEKGLLTAVKLRAKADLKRFEKLLVDISQVSLI